MKETFVTHSEPETFKIAESFARTLAPGAVVALTGELGAGKTVFAKGIARALGVKDDVTSPTFTLINEYSGDIPVYHMDFYRLRNCSEILDIGVEDYFYCEGISLVEWAEKMEDDFPAGAVRIILRHLVGNDRSITIERPE